MRIIINTRISKYLGLMHILFVVCASLLLPSIANGRQLVSLKEALNIAFVSASSFKREAVYLSLKEIDQIQSTYQNRKVEIRSRLVIRYKAMRNGRVVGHSYIDTHHVRTLSETILVSINIDNLVKRVEIISFREPNEYLATTRWLEQFRDQTVVNSKIFGKQIYGITGASLTARAIKKAVPRILTLHQFIQKLRHL